MRGKTVRMEAVVTEEIIARQRPEAQAIIRLLLARNAGLEAENAALKARIERLERQAKGKTPQNPSLPREHATSARPAAAACAEVKEETRRAARPPQTRAAFDPHRPVRRRAVAQARGVSALRGEALGRRPRTLAAPGLGSARDQAGRHRVPAAPVDLSVLWRNDLCCIAARRAGGPVGTAADGLHRASDGLLSSLLGEAFRGVVNCDRAKRYWQLDCLQWCWGHLKRDFQGISNRKRSPDCQGR